MDHIEKLKVAILAHIKANVPVQTLWGSCKSTNMQEGTMVAIVDDLEYEDVLIGLGGDLVEPEPGSKVLIGLIENKSMATMLLYAETTARRYINGNDNGGLVIADSVTMKLNAIEKDLNTLKQAFSSWSPVSGPTTDGGAGLKALAATWFAVQLATTQSSSLQSKKVSHG